MLRTAWHHQPTIKIDRSPRGFSARNGISVGTTYKEIKSGRLKAKKIGTRTIITALAEEMWQESLPDVAVDKHGRIIAGDIA